MTRKIVEYECLVEATGGALDDIVKAMIGLGWEPFGSFTVVDGYESASRMYCQAVVKYAPEPDEMAICLANVFAHAKMLADDREALIKKADSA